MRAAGEALIHSAGLEAQHAETRSVPGARNAQTTLLNATTTTGVLPSKDWDVHVRIPGRSDSKATATRRPKSEDFNMALAHLLLHLDMLRSSTYTSVRGGE